MRESTHLKAGDGDSGLVIVGLGELLWDEFPTGRHVGGAPANYCYHCRRLRADSFIVSAVGDDSQGKEIRAQLNLKGLNTTLVGDNDRFSTGSVSVEMDSVGVPTYTIRPDTAWDHLSETKESNRLAERADAVCFGTLAQRSPNSRMFIQSFLQKTKHSCLRVFDVNLRQEFYDRSTIEKGLELANVLKLNEEELVVLRDMFDLGESTDTSLHTLAEAFALDTVALTMGEDGCLIHDKGDRIRSEGAQSGAIVNTVGAGDCFTAVLTVGLLRGYAMNDVAVQANLDASYVCTQEGAMPLMPDIRKDRSETR